MSKPNDQIEGDKIALDKIKVRDIKSKPNDEVDNYTRDKITSNYN